MLMVTQALSARAASGTTIRIFFIVAPLFDDGLHIALRHALQARNQFIPRNAAIVAHHGDCRNATALDDGVSPAAAVVHAAHRAHAVAQHAAPADAVVAEILEEAQIAALDRSPMPTT